MINLVKVDSIPKRKPKGVIQPFLEEFMASDAQMVQILFTSEDYKSPKVCANVWYVAAKRSHYGIKVIMRRGNVYLAKQVITDA